MLVNNLADLKAIAHHLSAAVSTLPKIEAWLQTAVLLGLFAIAALPIGLGWKFLQVEILKATWQKITGIIAISFLMPGVTEELFFRVLLLPYPSETVSTLELWFWGCTSLVLFVAYHLLNALTFFPRGRKTFFNPVFLVLAALLGIFCSIAYLQSGFLWTAVVIHWIVVIIWLLLLGGYKKLYG